MALILHCFREFVYDVVVKQLLGLPRFQSLLMIVYDHINAIFAIIQRLFKQNKLITRLDLRRCIDDWVHCIRRWPLTLIVRPILEIKTQFNGRRLWPLHVSPKRCKTEGKLVLIINRKSYMSFRLVPKSVTLNDLERRNGPYFACFLRNLLISGAYCVKGIIIMFVYWGLSYATEHTKILKCLKLATVSYKSFTVSEIHACRGHSLRPLNWVLNFYYN